MPSSSERYVIFTGGPAVPIEPVQLLLDLEARGFAVERSGETLVVRPGHLLTAADREALARWKMHLLALIDFAAETVQ